MWRAQIGEKPAATTVDNGDDDWETDADYHNDIAANEKSQRFGTTQHFSVDMKELQSDVMASDQSAQERGASASQRDYKVGFGGKFGVQSDRQDRSAHDYTFIGKTEKHSSQQTDKSLPSVPARSLASKLERRVEEVRKNSRPKGLKLHAKFSSCYYRFASFILQPIQQAAAASHTVKSAKIALPKSQLNELEDNTVVQPPAAETTAATITAQAVYEYAKTDDDELEIQVGDLIINVNKLDEGWWFGENARSGLSGEWLNFGRI